ncbi:MAG: hypothetical protein OXG36_09830 [Caldilineaceae bacterium]|nr:hypothetical protein [Caldilineaceae bacterium]
MVPIGRTQDPSSESDPVKQVGDRQNPNPWCPEHLSERRAELEWRSLLSGQGQYVIAAEWNGTVRSGLERKADYGRASLAEPLPPNAWGTIPPANLNGRVRPHRRIGCHKDHCIPSTLPLQPDRAVTA